MAEISKLAAGSPPTIAGPRSPPRMAPSRVRRSRFAKVFASPWQPRHFCLSVGCTVSENTTEGAGAAVSQPAAANRQLHATNLRDQYLRHTSSGLTPIRITTGQTLRRLILPNSRTTIHQDCSLPRRFLLDRRNGIRPTARIRGTAGAERLGVTTLSRFVPFRLAPLGPSDSAEGVQDLTCSRDRRVEGHRGDSTCHGRMAAPPRGRPWGPLQQVVKWRTAYAYRARRPEEPLGQSGPAPGTASDTAPRSGLPNYTLAERGGAAAPERHRRTTPASTPCQEPFAFDRSAHLQTRTQGAGDDTYRWTIVDTEGVRRVERQ